MTTLTDLEAERDALVAEREHYLANEAEVLRAAQWLVGEAQAEAEAEFTKAQASRSALEAVLEAVEVGAAKAGAR